MATFNNIILEREIGELADYYFEYTDAKKSGYSFLTTLLRIT